MQLDASQTNYPDVAIDNNGHAVAVWRGHDGTNYRIYASEYDGSSWSVREPISLSGVDAAIYPHVAMNADGAAIAVWGQSDGSQVSVWANRFRVGQGWAGAKFIEVQTTGDADAPEVAVDAQGNAICVFRLTLDATCQRSLWTNRYDAGVGSWGTATELDAGPIFDAPSTDFQLTMAPGGDAFLIWRQNAGPPHDILGKRYDAASGSWLATQPVENDAGDARYARASMDDDGNVIAVWTQDDITAYSVRSRRYVAGVGWSDAVTVESGSVDAFIPTVATDPSGNAVCVWRDGTSGATPISSNRRD